MRILSLKLKDFRLFHKTKEIPTSNKGEDNISIEEAEDIEINFPKENLTVFIGENGSGKTSVLDALSILLTQLFTGYLKPIFPGEMEKLLHGGNSLKLDDDDIYLSKKPGETIYDPGFTSLELRFEYEDTIYLWSLKGARDEKGRFFQHLEVELPQDEKKKGTKELSHLVIKINDQLSSDINFNLPLITYYQTNRILYEVNSKTPEETETPDSLQLLAYKDSFTKNIFNFQTFNEWFKIREDNENEIRTREDNYEYRDRELEVVRTALKVFSNELDFQIDDLRVVRDISKALSGKGIYSLVFDKNQNHSLKLKSLSSGEKTILVLVLDLARRLAMANPGYLEEEPEYLLNNATGIVLIDEIDLHLHPKWQRLVVPALMKTFPGIQFIMTTHSDEVLKNVPPECIRKGQFFQEIPKYSQGHSTHYIRSELQDMDIRSPEVLEYLELIRKGLVDNERGKELKKKIDKLDPNSDERMRIDFAIKRKEALG